jgi:protein involved in polysaccharide export with SLBB domain
MMATGKDRGVKPHLWLGTVLVVLLLAGPLGARASTAQEASLSRLKVGDKLLLSVAGMVSAPVEIEVQLDGRIHLPRAGSVKVAGETVTVAEALVAQAYRTVYRDPIVALALKESKKEFVWVAAGRGTTVPFEWSPGLDLRTALAPGIVTTDLDQSVVRVFRDGKTLAEADLAELFSQDSQEWNGPLEPNDVVTIVPNPYVRVWVTGNVARPGQVKIEAGRTIHEAVSLAGGIVRTTTDQQLEESDFEIVLRRGGSEQRIPAVLAEGATPTKVEPGDSMSVELALVAVVVGGEVVRPGRYYVSRGAALAETVARAGGLKPTGTARGALLVRDGSVLSLDVTIPPKGPLDLASLARQGDVVYITTNQQAFTVLGRALRPGRYVMVDDTQYRASDALAAAGGAHPQVSTDRRMVIVRFGPDGKPTLINFNLDEFYKDGKAESNPVVLAGDTLVVAPKRELSVSSIASILAGLFSLDRILRR